MANDSSIRNVCFCLPLKLASSAYLTGAEDDGLHLARFSNPPNPNLVKRPRERRAIPHMACVVHVCVSRERAASMYAVQPYTTAVAVVELPYLLAQAIMFMPIVYFLIGKAIPYPK